MNLRISAVLVLALGYTYTSVALDARVIAMGRHDNFFMDEISIFRNPANISKYPNMIMGDLGIYKQDSTLDPVDQFNGLKKYNRDPIRPFFGGTLSYSLDQSTENGDQYPMLSMSAVINRYDKMLNYIDPKSKDFKGGNAEFKEPVGKIDVILGCALKGGGMIGAGIYFAVQKMEDAVNIHRSQFEEFESKLVKGNIGINWPVTKTMDLEASVATSFMSGIGWIKDTAKNYSSVKPAKKVVVADGDLSVRGDIRLFSALTTLNGDFVPHLGLEVLRFNGGTEQDVNMELGVGININIDRGFFWMGLEGLFNDSDSLQQGGGRISFGIERNVIWDWLVWRTGGTKTFLKQTGYDENTRMVENPEADASDDDLLAFGVGLNIENRLKVDGVVAEDIFYTFSNLFTGSHHHLMTRISVSYSF
jgi:hypothetical protein